MPPKIPRTEVIERRLCNICGSKRMVPKFPDSTPTEYCGHEIGQCKECLKRWVTTQIESTALIVQDRFQGTQGTNETKAEGSNRPATPGPAPKGYYWFPIDDYDEEGDDEMDGEDVKMQDGHEEWEEDEDEAVSDSTPTVIIDNPDRDHFEHAERERFKQEDRRRAEQMAGRGTEEVANDTAFEEARARLIVGVRCPDCTLPMVRSDIQKIATRAVQDRFAQLERRRIAETIPGWRWCLSATCDAGQTHKPKIAHDPNSKAPVSNLDRDTWTCRKCGEVACIPCDRPYHYGESCEDYKARIKDHVEEEDATLQTLARWTKRCPSCERLICRDGGCSWMKCTYCYYEFCWNCSEPPAHDRSCGCDGGEFTMGRF